MWNSRAPSIKRGFRLVGLLIVTLTAATVVLVACDSSVERAESDASATPRSCDLPKDIGVALRCVTFEGHVYAVSDINLQSHKIIFATSDDRTMQSYPVVASRLRSEGWEPILITNAGIYGTDNRPLGLLITPRGKVRDVARGTGGNGNFSWDSAVFQINADDTASIVSARDWQDNPRAIAATQSGPRLADADRINPDLPRSSSSTYARTAVGVDQANRHLVHIAVSRDGVTLFELASFLVNELRCSEALHLDGDLSAFYLPSAADKFVFSNPGKRIVTVLSVLKK
jgi:uncharacterized protein YigE (DUF2233 family)